MRALLVEEINIISGAGILDSIISPISGSLKSIIGGVGLVVSIPTIVLGAIAGVPTLGLGFVVMAGAIVSTVISAKLLRNN